MTTAPKYQQEFPTFDPATMPAIPKGFEDASWGAEPCPQFASDALDLVLWVDFLNPADREFGEGPRFSLTTAEANPHQLVASDDWSEILAAILGERFAAECRFWFGARVIAEIRRRNKTAAPGVCATHDFADANMTMESAFVDVLGRTPDVGNEDDASLWSAAWNWAKARHLTEN